MANATTMSTDEARACVLVYLDLVHAPDWAPLGGLVNHLRELGMSNGHGRSTVQSLKDLGHVEKRCKGGWMSGETTVRLTQSGRAVASDLPRPPALPA